MIVSDHLHAKSLGLHRSSLCSVVGLGQLFTIHPYSSTYIRTCKLLNDSTSYSVCPFVDMLVFNLNSWIVFTIHCKCRCKEVVMATVRAIFDIVDTSTNQVGAPNFIYIFSVCFFVFCFHCVYNFIIFILIV